MNYHQLQKIHQYDGKDWDFPASDLLLYRRVVSQWSLSHDASLGRLYFYLHEWLMFMGFSCRWIYTSSPMDPMGQGYLNPQGGLYNRYFQEFMGPRPLTNGQKPMGSLRLVITPISGGIINRTLLLTAFAGGPPCTNPGRLEPTRHPDVFCQSYDWSEGIVGPAAPGNRAVPDTSWSEDFLLKGKHHPPQYAPQQKWLRKVSFLFFFENEPTSFFCCLIRFFQNQTLVYSL